MLLLGGVVVSGSDRKNLWSALDFRLSEILAYDFYWAVAGAVAALATAVSTPAAVIRAVPVAAGLVGVVVGAVVAGIAVQTAFMDQAFLRKIRTIGRDPTRYIAPFLFTATTGVFSMLSLLVLGTMSAETSPVPLVVASFVAALLTVWTMTSLLQGLSTLVQFIHLKTDALDVPDDVSWSARDSNRHRPSLD
ncbi:hypothetical protein ABZS35_06705 [Micromonospora sp. NPDC005599]|uniref:hypothetical protein n=1 Tax=Micromonospora sp. NPDC005599 TaxID=3155715 RepID=UPI0033A9C0C4